MTALIRMTAPTQVHARIELGHWLAECGTPYCRNALRLNYGDGFLCVSPTGGACGMAYEVVWPDPETARKIVALLAYRPDWVTRNWLAHESVDDLLAENLLHGVEHCTPLEGGGAASLLWLDRTGHLNVLDEPLTIDAAPRPAIGGQ